MRLAKTISLLILTLLIVTSCGGDMGRLTKISLIPVYQGDSTVYINSKDRVKLSSNASTSSLLRNDLFIVKQDGLYGFIDDDAKQILPAIYGGVTPFYDGYAWVVRRDDYPSYINKKGELQFTLREAEMVEIFYEDLARFAVKSGKQLSYGFVDKNGDKVIKPIYNDASHFSSGLAAVMGSDKKWGYINAQGEVFLPAKYNSAKPFNGEEAIVMVNGKWGIINTEGGYILEPTMDAIIYDNGLYIAKHNDVWGWCKGNGEWVIEPQFKLAKRFFDADIAPVLVNDRWGYVNRDGELVIKPQFTDAFPFVDDMALVAIGDFFGFVNDKGVYVINPQYGSVSEDYVANAAEGVSHYSTVRSTR